MTASFASSDPAPDPAPDADAVAALLALFSQGRIADAGIMARQWTEQFPADGFGWKALSIAQHLGGDAAGALASMQQAAHRMPDDAEVHNNLGLALTAMRRAAEAESVLRRAVALAPHYTEAHNNLAIALYEQGKLAGAEACLRRALDLQPAYVKAHNNLGMVLQAQSRMGEAVEAYRRTLALQPDYADAHSNLLFCLSQVEHIDAAALMAEHARYAERFEAPWRARWPAHANSRAPERALRVGIVSGDLRDHPVAVFLEPVLAVLARSPKLSLHAYSNHAIDDAVSAGLRTRFASWTPVAGMNDDALAARIQADAIDILLDLSGHTAHNRLPVFARKPAPVQASWIGYPGSTGLQAMDYYLTDPFMLPPGEFDHQFTEKLLHLPVSAPFLPSPLSPPVNRLPALDKGYFTFGSFNRPSKLSAAVVALWARLLREVPTARMLLGAMPADSDHADIAALFVANGVARERLDFHPRADMASYLALHHQVDLCLDTFPYTGGTTTLHAAYMGVPTITLTGDTAAGRQGASILRHIGLDDFIASDADGFAAIGAAMAIDPPGLAGLRATLRARFAVPGTGELDAVGIGVERALRAIWRRWCQGHAAAPMQISLEAP